MLKTSVIRQELPEESILRRYSVNTAEGSEEGYADCYSTLIDFPATLEEYIAAFYTTPIFKIERAILGKLAGLPSKDVDAHQLATAASDTFSAWVVEQRADNQILLSDASGRTRSWLMIQRVDGSDIAQTRLLFGSAVIARQERNGRLKIGLLFSLLLGFHKAYSIILLSSARKKLSIAHRDWSGL